MCLVFVLFFPDERNVWWNDILKALLIKNYHLQVHILSCRCRMPPGGVLPMWWVIHMCRGFDPLFSLWQDRARSFWGTFSHPPTAKLSFGVQKLPIFTKIDLFGPKLFFFPRSFWVQFSAASGTPPSVFRPSTPPGRMPGSSLEECSEVCLRGATHQWLADALPLIWMWLVTFTFKQRHMVLDQYTLK